MSEQPAPIPAVRRAADLAAVAGLAAMTLLVLATVILRYGFSITYRWSDELARYLFIYVVFLGIAVAYRHGDHVRIDLLTMYLPPRARRALELPIHLAVAVMMLALGVVSLELVFGRLGRAYTPGMQIPRGIMYAAIPLGVVFLSLEILARLRAWRLHRAAPVQETR